MIVCIIHYESLQGRRLQWNVWLNPYIAITKPIPSLLKYDFNVLISKITLAIVIS